MDAKDEQPDIVIEDENIAARGEEEAIPDDVVQDAPIGDNSKPSDLSDVDQKELADVEAHGIDGENDPSQPPAAPPLVASAEKSRFRRFVGTKKGKTVLILVVILAIIGALAAIPFTRYKIAGLVLKKSVAVTVVDAKTKKPVTEANVTIDGISAKTDNRGKAALGDVPVGEYTMAVTKKYYQDNRLSYTVPIVNEPAAVSADLTATGRQVVLSVTNVITGQPLSDATVTASDTAATTDDQGAATIVLSADQETVAAVIKRDGYHEKTVELQVVDEPDANKLVLTPTGSLYYLSKKTGTINVMKANLDGSDEKVVVEGTGKEDDFNTVLIASRDWKYLALLSRRDGGDSPKVFIVDTASGQMKAADEGNAMFTLIGWTGHHFVYTVERNTANFWDDKRRALKTYDASGAKLTVVDETAGSGSGAFDFLYQQLLYVRVLGNDVVYAKSWNYPFSLEGSAAVSDKKAQLISVKAGTTDKKIIREFEPLLYGNLEIATYRPNQLYIKWSTSYFSYKDGAVKDLAGISEASFYDSTNKNYFVSPGGTKTYWSEIRNGKNVHLFGDQNGDNATEMLASEDYAPYGWYADDYVLLSKGGNQLYIAGYNEKTLTTPIKVTDYHKPVVTHAGYGYGYGGN